MKRVKPLAKGHLIEILRLQLETNDLYDPQWRKNNKLIHFLTAANTEISEMNDEIERIWKWYESKPSWEPEKALFELVDVVHFSASCLLVGRKEGIESKLLDMDMPTTERAYVTDLVEFDIASDWWMSFAQHSKTTALLQHPCECLCQYVGVMLSILGYTQEQYMQAHYKKNDRNRQRAIGGVIQGTYDKAAEKPLEL